MDPNFHEKTGNFHGAAFSLFFVFFCFSSFVCFVWFVFLFFLVVYTFYSFLGGFCVRFAVPLPMFSFLFDKSKEPWKKSPLKKHQNVLLGPGWFACYFSGSAARVASPNGITTPLRADHSKPHASSQRMHLILLQRSDVHPVEPGVLLLHERHWLLDFSLKEHEQLVELLPVAVHVLDCREIVHGEELMEAVSLDAYLQGVLDPREPLPHRFIGSPRVGRILVDVADDRRMHAANLQVTLPDRRCLLVRLTLLGFGSFRLRLGSTPIPARRCAAGPLGASRRLRLRFWNGTWWRRGRLRVGLATVTRCRIRGLCFWNRSIHHLNR